MFWKTYRLYKNIGKKIKMLAVISFIVSVILCLITGILFLIDTLFLNGRLFGGKLWWLGLLIMVLGPLCTFISSWLLYGYGELIDTSCDNTRVTARNFIFNLRKNQYIEAVYRHEVWTLYDEGVITYEEYRKSISSNMLD